MSDMVMHRAAVDAEFRAFLASQTALDTMPEPVAELDTAALEAWASDVSVGELYACAQSCSWGPFTIVCDGNTKSGL